MPRLLGPELPDTDSLKAMRARPLAAGQRWAAYKNHDLGHPECGHLTFLKVGPGCTFESAPDKRPDTRDSIGWRYLHVGFVDLASGIVVDSPDGIPAGH